MNDMEYAFDTSLQKEIRVLLKRGGDYDSRELNDNQKEGFSCVGNVGELRQFLICGDCFRWRGIEPSCNQRNCPRCQSKQARRLLDVYAPACGLIETGFRRRWIMVTLSGERVANENLSKEIKRLLKKGREFLKSRFKGGLIALEHTYDSQKAEYYLHIHALCFGDYQDIKEFSKDWGRWAWLSRAELTPHTGDIRTNDQAVSVGLTYILKYISKGYALQNSELPQLRGLRYISTFGELYNMKKPKIKISCRFCGGRVIVGNQSDIDSIERQKLALGDEPLELERAITWSAHGRIEVLAEIKGYYDKIHERWERWFLDKWVGVWLNWLVNI